MPNLTDLQLALETDIWGDDDFNREPDISDVVDFNDNWHVWDDSGEWE